MSDILVLNPGSTSTKIAWYRDTTPCWVESIVHAPDVIRTFPTIFSQLEYRLKLVLETVQNHKHSLSELSCVVSRGGLLPPLKSGAYLVNQEMLEVLEKRPVNHHASNLGAALAMKIAEPRGIPAYIYDPVTVDEMEELYRITGIRKICRHGQGHNLNMRAAALKYCADSGKAYQDQTLIVAHLGGGITLSLHHNGRIIDMISDDEGPFSPERAGLIPNFKLAALIDREHLSYTETMHLLQRKGGLQSLVGTTDVRQVQHAAESGDADAALALQAMALGVAQAIARLATDVSGKVDRIILTGGIACSESFTGDVISRVSFIAPTVILPGENEMQALAEGAYRVLTKKEAAKKYHAPGVSQFI